MLRRFSVRALQFGILMSIVIPFRYLDPSIRSIVIPAMAFVTSALSLIPLEPLWLERFAKCSFRIRGCHPDFIDFIQELLRP